MVREHVDAVVVGAGPNGLTAAARLARAGRRVLVVEAGPTVGGGSRTAPIGQSARYDVCAAVHPFGASSPAFEALGLVDHGLRWCHPTIALAHPFDDGSAAVLHRATAERPHATADLLGGDADRWRLLIDSFAGDWERWRHLALGPVVRTTLRHPLAMAHFGAAAALPATALWRLFRTRDARALLAGMAAHSGAPLSMPTTAGVALALLAAGSAAGMPVAAGGSQAIIDALADVIREAGGTIETGRRIESVTQLPPARDVLFDVTPGQAAAMVGARAPRWRHGVAAWKLDLLLSGPLPWSAESCRQAGTVHLGGEAAEIACAERATTRGGLADRPYVIVAQPSVADPTRAEHGHHVIWAYRHVANGAHDPRATTGIETQLDRFAPGWRNLELDRRVTTPLAYEQYNAAYVGGDIAGGAMTPWQTVARPRLALDPYRIRSTNGMHGHHDAARTTGYWLCSQSTPPGPGVHGMSGWHAAGAVLDR